MSINIEQFLQTFFEESFEGLDVMENGLLDIDKDDDADPELINTIFRAAHSIKGGAATFGLTEISGFTHVLETLLDEVRDGKRTIGDDEQQVFLKSVDVLRSMITSQQQGEEIEPDEVKTTQDELELLLNGGQASSKAKPVQEPVSTETEQAQAQGYWHIRFSPHPHLYKTGNDTVRIIRELADIGTANVTVDISNLPALADMDPEESYLCWDVELHGDIQREQLDDVFAWVEDDCDLEIEQISVTAKESPRQDEEVREGSVERDDSLKGEVLPERRKTDRRQGDRRATKTSSAESNSIRVDISKVDAVINLVGELVITQSMLNNLSDNFEEARLNELKDGLAQLERNTRELQEDVMRMRMLPISFVFNRFPRMVHDLSSKLDKEINLVIHGETTELDKTLIEKISDPLVHLVRNSIDHGLEHGDERVANNKPSVGTVTLNAYHKGGNIVIEVKDDGRGLNPDKLLEKAKANGVIPENANLNLDEIYRLIFMPGFSTADIVSDISGRGVGMDVVRKNIMSLGGSIDIESEMGAGTLIRIRLPLTLAILDGQSVLVSDQVYIVPLISIVESIQVKPGMINSVVGKGETLRLRDEYLPIVRLGSVFGVSQMKTDLTDALVVILESDGKKLGLCVDDLLGQQQVVIKSMEENYKRISGISGATILGDGSVALILDVADLFSLTNNPEGSSYSGGTHEAA